METVATLLCGGVLSDYLNTRFHCSRLTGEGWVRVLFVGFSHPHPTSPIKGEEKLGYFPDEH